MNKHELYTSLPILETDRLMLRAMQLDDVEDVFAYASDPDVPKYLRWNPHPSLSATSDYLQAVIREYEKGTDGPWAIELKTSGKVVGAIHIYVFNEIHRLVEIGYVLAQAYWGNGIMTEALKRVVDFIFAELVINRVQALCKIENKRSARVLEKAGFELEGTLREFLFEKDRYWDVFMYSIVKRDHRESGS